MLIILPQDPKPPLLALCDGQLMLDVTVDPPEEDFEDNIHIFLSEECPPEIKLLSANQVSFGLTSGEARILAQALLDAAERNDAWLASKRK